MSSTENIDIEEVDTSSTQRTGQLEIIKVFNVWLVNENSVTLPINFSDIENKKKHFKFNKAGLL